MKSSSCAQIDPDIWVNEWIWLFNVTFNNISVIYVTAHRRAGGLKKKLNLRSGSQRHRHFVGFFNVPVQAPTRDPPFYGYSEKPPHFSRLLRHAWGYGGHILDLTPGETRYLKYGKIYMERFLYLPASIAYKGPRWWWKINILKLEYWNRFYAIGMEFGSI